MDGGLSTKDGKVDRVRRWRSTRLSQQSGKEDTRATGNTGMDGGLGTKEKKVDNVRRWRFHEVEPTKRGKKTEAAPTVSY